VVGLIVAWVLAEVDAGSAPAPSPPASGAPVVVQTPWPAELPCAQPRALWFDARLEGTVVWSSADGAETRSFLAAKSSVERRAPRGFPAGRLTRLAGVALGDDGSGTIVGVGCPGGTEITWGPCPGGACVVGASYLGHPLPKMREPTRYWTDEIPGSPWADTAPDVHWTRFFREVGRREDGDPAAARAELRLAQGFVIELRDRLANACGARRCSRLVRDTQAKLAAYLRDRAPTLTAPSRREVDHWNYVWSWTATGGGVPLALSCDDMTESRDLLCDLKLDLGEVNLQYGTFHRDVELYAATDKEHRHPLGRILDSAVRVGETDRERSTIDIEGRLLNLQER
jgi:hypothetical protein